MLFAKAAAIEALLEAGADVNLRHADGKTPWDIVKEVEGEELEALKENGVCRKLNDACFKEGAQNPVAQPVRRAAPGRAPVGKMLESLGYVCSTLENLARERRSLKQTDPTNLLVAESAGIASVA